MLTPEDFKNSKPFNHVVIDNFFSEELANKIAEEFPNADSDFWYEYKNQIEVKKACSDWNRFPSNIYSALSFLLSPAFTNQLTQLTGCNLYPDYGLHGGGLHCHKKGGKLNTHLDYSIHPKLKLQRKLKQR